LCLCRSKYCGGK